MTTYLQNTTVDREDRVVEEVGDFLEQLDKVHLAVEKIGKVEQHSSLHLKLANHLGVILQDNKVPSRQEGIQAFWLESDIARIWRKSR